MFGSSFTLFTFLGLRVRANVSWLFLALLVIWSLATGFFPTVYPELQPGTYWALAVCGTIGLFFSLLFHEFSHSLVARSRGLPISGITLFLFGGVAEMHSEPPDPKTEFWIAIAGPLASMFLALVFAVMAIVMEVVGLPGHVAGVASYLGYINLLLAIFNMVPGFPLDGGRVLRAALWSWKGDVRWATRWASGIGQGFGLVLVGLGILSVLGGNFIGGMWWFLIGLFVRAAAQAAYQQLVARQTLQGEKISAFMSREPVTVPPTITIHQFVEQYLYRYEFDMFPITEDDRLIGCASLRQAKAVPRDQWDIVRVGDICETCATVNTIDAGADAAEAVDRMREARNGRLMVLQDNRLVGILTLKDLLHHLHIRTRLGDE